MLYLRPGLNEESENRRTQGTVRNLIQLR
jgi:hypothetical protein